MKIRGKLRIRCSFYDIILVDPIHFNFLNKKNICVVFCELRMIRMSTPTLQELPDRFLNAKTGSTLLLYLKHPLLVMIDNNIFNICFPIQTAYKEPMCVTFQTFTAKEYLFQKHLSIRQSGSLNNFRLHFFCRLPYKQIKRANGF